MILVMPSIKGCFANPGGTGRLGELFANFHGREDGAAFTRRLFRGAGRGQRDAVQVVDHLGVDVLRRSEYAQSRPLGRADDLLGEPGTASADA